MIVEPVHYIISLDDIVIRYCRRGVYTKESNGNLDRSNVLKTVLAVLLVFAFLQNWGMSITNEKKIPIEEYNGTVPFATIQDFAGEGSSDYTLTMMGLNMGFNTIEDKSDWIAPRCIEYNEHATVKSSDGKIIDGGLYIDYCELRNPKLAKVLAQEFYRIDKMKKGVELTDIPDLQADYVIAYFNNLHFPTVIIQKGNIVVKVYFFQNSANYTMPIEEWAEMICDSLGNNKS